MSTSGGNRTGYVKVPAGLTLSSHDGVAQLVQPAIGELRLAPLYLPLGLTTATLGAQVTTAGDGTSTGTACLFADDGTGKPGALLLAGGALATATAGLKSGAAVATLPPGWVWAGVLALGVTAATFQGSAQLGVTPWGSVSRSGAADLSATTWAQTGLAAVPANFAGALVSANVPDVMIGS